MTVGLLMSAAARRPLAIPLSALCLSVSLAVAQPAWAQEATVEPASQSSASARQYNIPAQSLGEALIQFARQSGLEVSANNSLITGKRSTAVTGSMTANQALGRLLADTNLNHSINAGMVSLSERTAGTLQPITVSAGGAQTGSTADAYRVSSSNVGALGNATLQDTPYSVEVYSREFMDNVQARSLADITRYDASISLSDSDLKGENNSFNIRGITPDFETGQKLDGLNFRSRAKDMPLEHIENVQVLKGASGFLYGFGAPGGIVNYVLKRPTEEFTGKVAGQVTDSGLFLVHGDLGGRGGDEDRFGYRINLVGETGDTYIDDAESERKSASIALDWRISPSLTWQVDALNAQRESTGGYFSINPNSDGSYSSAPGKPLDPIDGDKRLAPSWVDYESEHRTYGSDLIWFMAENWESKLSYRYSDNYRNPYMPILYANADGDYSARVYHYNNLFESEQMQLMVSGTFETGFIRHELTTGFNRSRNISSNSMGAFLFGTDLGTGNLSNPEEFADPMIKLDRDDAKFNEYSDIKRKEAFLSDTLHLAERWDLIVGARYGEIDDVSGDYKESAITPTLAAIYRPVPWMSLYASYVESLEQGAIAPVTAANANEVFDPMISEQYETGIKIDQQNWSASAAVFQLTRALTYTDSNNVFNQDGEALYQGLELAARTRIGEQWMVGASTMWLDASNEKTTDPTLEGEDIQGVAQEQYRLFGEYDIPGSTWVLTGGATHTGKRPVDPQGQWHVDAVTLFDLGARYATKLHGRQLTVRLNVDNLSDEAYWLTSAGSSGLSQGAPRTVTLGAELDF